jgi:NAD(P)-dependent dehydrogenase (short-subunit alcohol dehydrogenase family)
MPGALSGKRVLVYGGGTGLGLGCAKAMAEAGASIFITGRRREKLEAAAKETGAGLHEGDFTREADVEEITSRAVEFLGGLDTLVVSSGTSSIGSTLSAKLADFEKVMSTNLTGPFLAVRAAAPHLICSAPASVIMIASIVATVPMKERVAYCTSKAGLLGMTRAMAIDLAGHRVRVNAISPSLVLTELAREIMSREADPKATMARREAQHPLGRLGQPQDIGSAAVYLAADDSSWMTGQNVILDGGLSLQ